MSGTIIAIGAGIAVLTGIGRCWYRNRNKQSGRCYRKTAEADGKIRTS